MSLKYEPSSEQFPDCEMTTTGSAEQRGLDAVHPYLFLIMCSGSEAGSYSRLIGLCIAQLGLRVIKKKKTSPPSRTPPRSAARRSPEKGSYLRLIDF